MDEAGTVSGGKVWSPPSPSNSVLPSPPAKTQEEERKERNWATVILAIHVILPGLIIPAACLYYAYTRPLFSMKPFMAEEVWNGTKAESIEPFFFFPIFSTLLYASFLVFLVCARKQVRVIVDNWDDVRSVMWVTQALMAMALFSISAISYGNSYTENHPEKWAEHYYGYELLEEPTGDQEAIKVRESDGVESVVSIHKTGEGFLLYKDEAHLQAQLDVINENTQKNR